MYTVYIITTMYKGDTVYTIKEFRAHMRQAFNDADQGHQVVIERYGQKYQLVSLVDTPLPHHSFDSIPGKAPEKIASEPSARPDVPSALPAEAHPIPNAPTTNMFFDETTAPNVIEDPELHCCKTTEPCRHWAFNGERMIWRNTLSGREKVAE